MASASFSFLLAFTFNAPSHSMHLQSHGPERGFATYEEFKDYVSNSGVKFAELGASKGHSRKMLEDRLHVKNVVKPECPVVLGLDVDDEKLKECNRKASSHCPFCVKADLRDVVRGHSESVPLLDGTQMQDVLEHINQPIDPKAAASLPARRTRKLHGYTFDTALHTTALELWTASCLMSEKACFMEGPCFDNEEALRATGHIQYYAQWSGHVCHVNSTSMAAAIARLPTTRNATTLLALSREIRSSTDSRILRLPPSVEDQACDDSNPSRFSLGCDRHQYGSKEEIEMADRDHNHNGSEYAFRYPKDMEKAVDLSPLGIYEKMHTFVAFDVDPDGTGRHMSRETASMLLKIPERDLHVVSCKLHGRALARAECAAQLFKMARAS